MIKKKFLAILMAALVVASTPVYATPYAYTPLTSQNGLSSVIFDTQISGSADASLPTVTIAYSVGTVTKTGSATADGVSGDPSIAPITVTAGSSSVIPNDGTFEVQTTVSFAGVTFTKPGEYVWPITLYAQGSSSNVPGFSLSTPSPTKYLHVNIIDIVGDETNINTNGTLAQSTVYLSNSNEVTDEDTPPDGVDDGKITSFPAASYGTKSLTINAAVAGNMGDKTQTFDYEVSLTGCNPGTTIEGEEVDNEGEATLEYNDLTHGESFTIEGIPDGAGYTVEQATVEGYSTSILVTTGS